MAITPAQQQEIQRQKAVLNPIERAWATQIEHKIDALLMNQTEIRVQDLLRSAPLGAEWTSVLADIIYRYEQVGWGVIPSPLRVGTVPVLLTFVPKSQKV